MSTTENAPTSPEDVAVDLSAKDEASKSIKSSPLIDSLLGTSARVTLSDGRIFEGTFECVDNSFNAIIRTIKMGLVMAPGKHITKFERMVTK